VEFVVRFKEYIAGRRASFTAQGDFVRFALADPDFPDVQSWTQLEEYLKGSSLPEARRHSAAAETVWNSYSKTAGRMRYAS
jgi:hypothetical protein